MLNVSLPRKQSPRSIYWLIRNIVSIISLRDLALEISCYKNSLKIDDDSFCSLTNLKSLRLTISPCQWYRQASVCVSHLTGLTSLALGGVAINGGTDPLSKLVSLSLDSLPLPSGDPSNALEQMTKLEELSLGRYHKSVLPNHVLSRLTNLRRLSLTTIDFVDLEFFQSLASLPKLTSLAFWSMSLRAQMDDFRVQFILLTQLEELRLHCGSGFDVLGLFGYGTFPRLRHLAIACPKLEEGEEQMLFSRFSCLRSFKPM